MVQCSPRGDFDSGEAADFFIYSSDCWESDLAAFRARPNTVRSHCYDAVAWMQFLTAEIVGCLSLFVNRRMSQLTPRARGAVGVAVW